MSATSGEARQVSPVGNALQPTWSPDGRRLAVLRPDPHPGVWTIDVRTSRLHRIYGGGASIEGPAWSPSGRQVAFARQRSPTNWDLYSTRADGGATRRLTHTNAQETGVTWSPDGRRIAFARQLPSGRWAIFVAGDDGAGATPVTPVSMSAVEPVFSPDGREIAFTLQNQARSTIAAVQLRTHAIRTLTDGRLFASQPSWSKVAGVAFVARRVGVEETD